MADRFEAYRARYKHIAMRRIDGVLEMRLHTEGGPLVWGGAPHEELSYAFYDVARDRDNRSVILTGTGETFCVPVGHGEPDDAQRVKPRTARTKWDPLYSDARHLLTNLMNIEVPVIAAINGPVSVHADLPLLCDIVLAADTATIQDAQHFTNLLVPGDGIHVIWPMLIGPNRARYFLLTAQVLSAAEAHQLGLVGEVLRSQDLEARAWEIARGIAAKPATLVRGTRAVLTQNIKRALLNDLSYGLAVEGLAALQVEPSLWDLVADNKAAAD
jgi:enoyl-CoA hydratase/carnithine racemase